MRPIRRFVVHCSESPDGRPDTLEDIRLWHMSPDPRDPSKPWSDIGYHWVIERSGPPRAGRPVERPGAHVGGQNADSIGICLIGTRDFEESQLLYLEGLLHALLIRFPGAEVCGHTDLDSGKTCPNFNVGAWWRERQKHNTG
ncbi:MAG: N-acetylmuramoyl-L-alanine amidase [Saccharospirillum sp.]|nr:N-acetylmuramoyl-L-alanine amidase [Saccharospirillum sp.]